MGSSSSSSPSSNSSNSSSSFDNFMRSVASYSSYHSSNSSSASSSTSSSASSYSSSSAEASSAMEIDPLLQEESNQNQDYKESPHSTEDSKESKHSTNESKESKHSKHPAPETIPEEETWDQGEDKRSESDEYKGEPGEPGEPDYDQQSSLSTTSQSFISKAMDGIFNQLSDDLVASTDDIASEEVMLPPQQSFSIGKLGILKKSETKAWTKLETAINTMNLLAEQIPELSVICEEASIQKKAYAERLECFKKFKKKARILKSKEKTKRFKNGGIKRLEEKLFEKMVPQKSLSYSRKINS